MFLASDTSTPWWASSLVAGVNVVLGAIIGFFATQVKDWRDRKRTETAFLMAVYQELTTLRNQFKKSAPELEGSLDRLRQGAPLRLVLRLSTRIFDSQLSTLKNLNNPLILRIVDFYSTLGVMDDMTATINTISDQMVHANVAESRVLEDRLRSAVMVTQENLALYRKKVLVLMEMFPSEIKTPKGPVNEIE